MIQSKSLHFTATSGSGKVSAIVTTPKDAIAMLVLAHGAGAGMKHPFLEKVAAFLAEEGVATFRFHFPYMENGRKVPDLPAVAMKTVQSAVATAKKFANGLPLFAGGKSFGGRMTSQAAASGMLTTVKGIVFWGFPLHAQGKPSQERAAHLQEVKIPMLFIQGTRDMLADISLMRALCHNLGKNATLREVEKGDHSFYVSREKDRDESVLREACKAATAWMKSLG